MRLILASASPRRSDLLRAAGYEFDTCAADVDESVRANESPAEYVQRLASEKSAAAAALTASAKATAVHRSFTRRPKGCATEETTMPEAREFGPAGGIVIVGADTTVVVDGLILGKPHDDDEAAAMLRRLSGRRHDVLTGLSVRAQTRELCRVESTAVYVAALNEDEIAWYVRSGEGRDKAGAYAIQGLASRFIPWIEGSYSNVVGLPVAAVVELIRRLLEPCN